VQRVPRGAQRVSPVAGDAGDASEPVRVELDAPGGEHWTWGAAEAGDRVTGTALDFCLIVTQRRNVADTNLRVTGRAAAEWITIAQAFAGAPADGRPAGLFAALPTGGRP